MYTFKFVFKHVQTTMGKHTYNYCRALDAVSLPFRNEKHTITDIVGGHFPIPVDQATSPPVLTHCQRKDWTQTHCLKHCLQILFFTTASLAFLLTHKNKINKYNRTISFKALNWGQNRGASEFYSQTRQNCYSRDSSMQFSTDQQGGAHPQTGWTPRGKPPS